MAAVFAAGKTSWCPSCRSTSDSLAKIAMQQTAILSYEGLELEALTSLSNYHDWILEGFAPYLSGRVAEIGAGIGTMSLRLRPLVDSLVVVEPAANLLGILAERLAGSDVERIAATAGEYLANAPAASLDAIVMTNVLEHIADDEETLRTCHRALRPGGYLLLFVPALPALFGSLDQRFGHRRRYRRAALRASLDAAGFSISRLVYLDLVGIAAWWMACRIMGAGTISARSAQLYDRLVVPVMRPIERAIPPPLGKSLLAAARA